MGMGVEQGNAPQSVMPNDIMGLRKNLVDFLQAQFSTGAAPGTQKAQNAYTSLMNTTAGTGSPFDMTELFKSAKTNYASTLDEAIGQAKESTGMKGQLRSSMGYEAVGKAAGKATNEFQQYLMETAKSSYEAAQQRKIASYPLLEALAMMPGKMSAQGGQVETGKYPWLDSVMKMATSYPPTGTQDSTVSGDPMMQLLAAIIGGASKVGAAAI
jgi:hypothetical protein